MKDPEIRKSFKAKFLKNIQEEVLVLEEVGILKGQSIVDIALVGPSLMEAFEIKSGADSVSRLPSQIEAYNQVFDSITLILEYNHLSKALALIPEYWGVIVVEKSWEDIEFKYYRRPKINPNVSVRKKIDLLWRDELIQTMRMLKVKGYSKLKRKKLGDLLVKTYNLEQVNRLIYEILKNRVGWKQSSLFEN